MDNKVSSDTTIGRIAERKVLLPFLCNYNGGFHVREIARKINTNHRTVSLALSGLEKVGILKCRKEGRNNVYTLNPSNPLTKDYISAAESQNRAKISTNPLLLALWESIISSNSAVYNPVILFGSYARNEETKNSDIDLLIIDENKEESRKIAESLKKFELKYGKKVHLKTVSEEEFEKGLNKKEPLFLEILESHITINSPQWFIDILWRHFYGKG